MPQKIIISRIQNRRGALINLPQPLEPGEIALTTDTFTSQVWIGNDNVPPFGIRTFLPDDGDGYLVTGDDQTDFDGVGNNGSFTGGSGHDVGDVITLSPSGTQVEVDAEAGGIVTEFRIIGSGLAVEDGDTLTQSATSGSGTGFSITVGENNVNTLTDKIDNYLTRIARITFTNGSGDPVPITQAQFEAVRNRFTLPQLVAFFSPSSVPLTGYDHLKQLLWDGEATIFFGMRITELTPFGWDNISTFLTDMQEQMDDNVLAVITGLPPAVEINSALADFGTSWLGAPNEPRIKFLENNDLARRQASGNISALINIVCGCVSATWVTTLSNIELTTSATAFANIQNLFETVTTALSTSYTNTWSSTGGYTAQTPTDQLVLSSDASPSGGGIEIEINTTDSGVFRIVNTRNQISQHQDVSVSSATAGDILVWDGVSTWENRSPRNQVLPTNEITGLGAGGTIFTIDTGSSEHVMFVEYSLNGSDYTAGGTLKIIKNSNGQAQLIDDRVLAESPPLRTGSLDFAASVSGNDLILSYTSTLSGSNDIRMRYTIRRWGA